MFNSKRFSLSNFPGRDDDADDLNDRQEQELRRRIRESDPMFAQKRLEAQQKAALERKQQQQQLQQISGRGFLSTTSLPTPEQAALTREQEARALSPSGRSTLLLRQSAQQPYLSTPPRNTTYGGVAVKHDKRNFVKWMDVATESDVNQLAMKQQQELIADTLKRFANDSAGASNELEDMIGAGLITPEAVQLFEEKIANGEDPLEENNNNTDGRSHHHHRAKSPSASSKKKALPEAAVTHQYARRCIDVSRKTASIRYRDVCNARTADEMGALGVDPELLGHFHSGGGMMGAPKNNHNHQNMDQERIDRENEIQHYRNMNRVPKMPDNFDGVPVRGDFQARLLAYRKTKEKDKLVTAQRQLVTQQARARQEKELEAKGLDVRELDAAGAAQDKNLSEEERRLAQRNYNITAPSNAPSAEEIFKNCAVYLDDEDEGIKRAATDPGFPLAMRLGTAQPNPNSTSMNISFSGLADASQTDNEDLIILTTPPLRLASKAVLQAVFTVQASDLRLDSIPSVPQIQFLPVRSCPMFVQRSHTLMMHEIKRQLRDHKAVEQNTFVVWTRVLLSRSLDPEDDVVAADDCHIEYMAPHDARLPNNNNNNNNTPSRRRQQQLDVMSPTNQSRKAIPVKSANDYTGGTTLDISSSAHALLSGGATVDVMLVSPRTNLNNATSSTSPTSSILNRNNKMSKQQQMMNAATSGLVAVSPNDVTMDMLRYQIEQEGYMHGSAGRKRKNDNNIPENETLHQKLYRSRVAPALPVLVRAPRPILVKPPERSLFQEPAAPTAADIANEFKEFATTIRTILDQRADPPGASRFDHDHVATPPAELLLDEDDDAQFPNDDDDVDEDFYIEEDDHDGGEPEEEDHTKYDYFNEEVVDEETGQKYMLRRRRRKKGVVAGDGGGREKSSSKMKAPAKQEGGANDWAASKQMAAQLDMDEVYQPIRVPSQLEAIQLLNDAAPFESQEHATLTAKVIVAKLRDSALPAGATPYNNNNNNNNGKRPPLTAQSTQQKTVETERLKHRLYEALDYVKKCLVEATTKVARADSQVDFRFKMQESIVKRESDGTLFATAAKSVLNADQRLNMMMSRIESDIQDIQYTLQRQQVLTTAIARDRDERSASRSRSQYHQGSPGGINNNSSSPQQQHNRGTPMKRNPLQNPSAFKPAPQPTSVPADLRRPVEPVVLKYASAAEIAPASVTAFLENQREGSVENPAREIPAEVSSPAKKDVHPFEALEEVKPDEKKKKVEEEDDSPKLVTREE